MAKLTDPDSLTFGVEIVVDSTGPKTIQLIATGTLDDDPPSATSGVTGQAVYSKLVDGWEATLAYRRHSFPIKAYGKQEGEWINTWGPDDEATRNLIRDFGWVENDGREEMCVLTLGDFPDDADQAYYAQASGGDATVVLFDKTGEVNERVSVFGTAGSPDNSGYCGVYYRTRPNFYDFYDIVEGLQLTALEPIRYSIPLASVVDPNIVESDGTIDGATEPWQSMELDYLTGEYGYAGAAGGAVTWTIAQTYAVGDAIADQNGRYFRITAGSGPSAGDDSDLAGGSDGGYTYEIHPGERQIGATYYLFSRVIAGASCTLSEGYQWGARQERVVTDINGDAGGDAFGTVYGQLAVHLYQTKGAGFDGTILKLAEGVMLDAPAAAEANNVLFFPHSLDGTYPNSNQGVQYPFAVNLEVIMTSNLNGGQLTIFFENNDTGDDDDSDFDTDNAIVVQEDDTTPIDVTISGTTMNFTFDYDVNVQRGSGSNATPAPLKCVAIYPGSGEWTIVDATITRIDNVEIRMNAIPDRNYFT
jgi:hypothetical protein